jgi:hypothetical protein
MFRTVPQCTCARIAHLAGRTAQRREKHSRMFKTFYSAAPTTHGLPWHGCVQVYTEATAALRAQGMPAQPIQDAVNQALAQKTTMLDPDRLCAAGVPVTRILQQAGELVITFPRGYHAGFSAGANVGEAANFCLPRWFEHGLDGSLRALRICKTPVRVTATCAALSVPV